eukprot:2915721-Karenia_brevis.AAC.1
MSRKIAKLRSEVLDDGESNMRAQQCRATGNAVHGQSNPDGARSSVAKMEFQKRQNSRSPYPVGSD